MNSSPIRILQCVNVMDRAGLETMLMNYYRNIDKTKIQFDFLTHRDNDGSYDDEIKKMGGRVYHAPRLIPGNYIKYFRWMKKFFRDHPEYIIVHSHIDSMSYFPLLAAKKAGIKYRISHSHSSNLPVDFKYPIKIFAKMNLKKVSNIHFACGKEAGHFLFGDSTTSYINNAINLKSFSFNNDIRIDYRNKMNISLSTLVIGHVGRFLKVKNQLFLIDIFYELIKIRPDSVLILIGKGPDEFKIRKKIDDLGISSKVIILIDRQDVNKLYNVMDVFVMPSLYEGLPLVGIEAQSNGLPCLFSNTISKDVLLTNNSISFQLKRSPLEWAEEILKQNICRNNKAEEELRLSGYDIREEVKILSDKYMGYVNGDII